MPSTCVGPDCQRVRRTAPNVSDNTHVFTIGHETRGTRVDVDSDRVTKLLRLTCCRLNNEEKGYAGITESEIGTRSIRSGAAISLFLLDHSVEKIMILGCWSFDAFMVYIRPHQVMEKTSIMSGDMARSGGAGDLNGRASPRRNKGAIITSRTMPRFYLRR
jgi:hypothetical protein